MTKWTQSKTDNAKHLGTIEIEGGDYFEVLQTPDRLIFGGYTNTGFIESGYIVKDEYEDDQDLLTELVEDLEVYYRDGSGRTNRIVFNERM